MNYASWYEDKNSLDKSHVSLTFSICYLINSLENIHKYKIESLKQHELLRSNLKDKANEVCFQSPSLFNLFSEISVSLVQIRIIQNTLLTLIGKKIKKSFPSSMNEYLIKSKNRSKCDTEKEIHRIISDYWNDNGLKAKQYRDLDQHFGQLFHHAVLTGVDTDINIELRLPDNPKEKSWNRFTYEKKVDAIQFIQESFNSLHNLINKISCLMGYDQERLFDLNMALNDDYKDYLTVVFDPFQGYITGHEIFEKDGKTNCITHIEKCDLDCFSFVKVPEYFKGTRLPIKYYMTGKTFKLKD